MLGQCVHPVTGVDRSLAAAFRETDGRGPDAAVVDRLKVYGLDNLRVIDASVLPVIAAGNTNGPTVTIAEKGAAMMQEDARG